MTERMCSDKMFRIVAVAYFATSSLNGGVSYAQAPACALQKPSPLDLNKVQPLYRQALCSDLQVGKARCDKRWAAITPLMQRLVKDEDVQTVGQAAFLLATVETETGGVDYNPTASEQYYEKHTPSYYPWIGRGWLQLTHQEKYAMASKNLVASGLFKGRDVNLLKNPKLTGDPDISYALLVLGLTKGWIEVYRRNPGGGCNTPKQDCTVPIRLSDFVSRTKFDYDHARAISLANCVNPALPNGDPSPGPKQPCADILYDEKGYIPAPNRLMHGTLAARYARGYEKALCAGMGMTD